MNHFSETTTTSFGENLGGSFLAIFFGILLLIASIILLSFNENRSVNQTLALEDMKSNIITLSENKYNPKYDNKAVLVQGTVKPTKELEDKLFNVKSNGLILKREVEVYQWKEQTSSKSEDKLGGSTQTVTNYDYITTWSSSPIDSSSFKHIENHVNPSFLYKNSKFSTDATIGELHLSQNVVSHFGIQQNFTGLENLPKKIGKLTNYKSFLYQGEDPTKPAIGDIKITYSQTPMGVYSIAGMMQGKEIVNYVSKNKKELIFISSGKVSADSIFQGEIESNTLFTWLLRIVGLIVMYIGVTLIMSLLVTLANVLPLFGSLMGGAVSIVAAALTLILGSITIAIAWFASRPMLSLIIVIVGVGLGLILSRLKKEKVIEVN